MRPIHFVSPTAGLHLQPLCGDWGSMASHWTEDAGGVTCGGCLDALRRLGPVESQDRPGVGRTA